MIKLKKLIKKWLSNFTPIGTEINPKFNNKKLPKCSETLMKLKMFSPILKKENFMIPEE